MTATYTIPEYKRSDMEKAIRRMNRKAEKYGTPLNAEFGQSYVKEIKVTARNEEGYTEIVDKQLVEVFDMTITSEVIRNEGYTVEAKIDHLEGGNFVTMTNNEAELDRAWTALKPFCEHCGSNHGLKVTYIVKGHGCTKQVGRTCLKEYCGIDPQALGIWNEILSICLDEDCDHTEWDYAKATKVFDIADALALAIEVIKMQGYVKSDETNSNKYQLKEQLMHKVKPLPESLAQAEEIIEAAKAMKSIDELFAESDEYKAFNASWHKYNDPAINEIKGMTEYNDNRFDSLEEYKQWLLYGLYQDIAHAYEDEDGKLHTEGEVRASWMRSYPYKQSAGKADFLINNIRTLAKTGYCKDTHLGFVAYAPIAYEQYCKALSEDTEKAKQREESAKVSEYVGQIGERITVEVAEMKLLTSWESDYGYTYLYRFVDNAGNVLIWFASRPIEDAKKIKGTIKSHSERDGVKQTVLTRCSRVA